jgi:hypothetical protein
VLLHRTVHGLNEHIQGCSAELVFNLDEVGILDWEDHKTRKDIILETMRAREHIMEHSEMSSIFLPTFA